MQTATESTVESAHVTSVLNYIIMTFNITFSEHIVRKLAHVLEFALLGFLGVNAVSRYKISAVVCLFVAVIDEFIQKFSPGRSSQYSDIILDYFGVLIGMAVYFFLCYLIKRRREDK